jgi:DMSO/TMAO reductase YedYZ molybdopterin-dependent catalytic subunit/thiosulfate reductase cytochrome b subunit
VRIRPSTLLWLVAPLGAAVVAAYVQWLASGLPPIAPVVVDPGRPPSPHGFPAWICVTHYVNLVFLVLLLRSGLQILMDHPRLYWNVHSTPGTEWARFTPVSEIPRDRVYTAKEDARYLTPWIGLPGGRHTLGLSRHWHFAGVLVWVATGVTFVALLFATDQWRRLVPTSTSILPGAWAYFVHYVTLHMPPEPDGFYAYNPLQQLAYFGVVFVLAPLSIATGPAMSPALVNRFSWYRRLPGNRQIARSLHFLALVGYVVFAVAHVAMVAGTGLVRNMNHITVGRDDLRLTGVALGGVGLVVLALVNVAANVASHRAPRQVQEIGSALVNPVLGLLLSKHAPRAQYRPEDISPFFWPNGRMPVSDEWKALVANDFRDYRLRVFGLVERPIELSLAEIRALPKRQQITLHHCIQGWSGIAEWGGHQMLELARLVRPTPEARAVIFYSFGPGEHGGLYYDSHTIENAMHEQTLLAYEMNYRPLEHVHGAPLRLRVENQLGFKMVKWISAIELAKDYRHVSEGMGGSQEDRVFFDTMADI